MNFNLLNLIYFAFRFGPFILIFFFIISSFFNQDVKCIIYIVGLLVACLLGVLTGNSLSLFDLPKKNVNSQCHVLSMGSAEPMTKIPFSIIVYAYTLFYLALPIYNFDKGVADLPLFILFTFLIFVETIWLTSQSCFNAYSIFIACAIGLGVGLGWAYIIYNSNITQIQYFTILGAGKVCTQPAKVTFQCSNRIPDLTQDQINRLRKQEDTVGPKGFWEWSDILTPYSSESVMVTDSNGNPTTVRDGDIVQCIDDTWNYPANARKNKMNVDTYNRFYKGQLHFLESNETGPIDGKYNSHDPDSTQNDIARSWDPEYAIHAISVKDCRIFDLSGVPMGMKMPMDDTIVYCNKTTSSTNKNTPKTPWVVFENELRPFSKDAAGIQLLDTYLQNGYPVEEIQDCSTLRKSSVNMTDNPISTNSTIPNEKVNDSVKCIKADGSIDNTIYRVGENTLNPYPSNLIGYSWNKDYLDYKTIDCNGIKISSAMKFNPHTDPVSHNLYKIILLFGSYQTLATAATLSDIQKDITEFATSATNILLKKLQTGNRYDYNDINNLKDWTNKIIASLQNTQAGVPIADVIVNKDNVQSIMYELVGLASWQGPQPKNSMLKANLPGENGKDYCIADTGAGTLRSVECNKSDTQQQWTYNVWNRNLKNAATGNFIVGDGHDRDDANVTKTDGDWSTQFVYVDGRIMSPHNWKEFLYIRGGNTSQGGQTIQKHSNSRWHPNAGFTVVNPTGYSQPANPQRHNRNKIDDPRGNNGCFVGESLVTMADGSKKRIDAITTGDCVMSGLTGAAVQVAVVDVIPVNEVPMAMIGFNGFAPFSTTTHCFFTEDGKRTSYDREESIRAKHWRPEDIVPLQEGSVIRYRGMDSAVTTVTDIHLCDISNTVVYNLLTSDHSYVVNGFCVSDDFPDLMGRPEAAIRIYFLLKKIQELGVGSDMHSYKDALEYADDGLTAAVDVSKFPEYFAAFMQLCQRCAWAVRIADELWKYEVDRFD